MNFKLLTKEQIDNIYPNQYNIDILKSYRLMDLSFNTTYLYYYSCYKYVLDNYLNKILNLKELDNEIAIENKDNKFSNFYKELSSLNLNNVFIRNNIFLDRLTNEEFQNYQKIYESKDLNNLENFVINTYKKLIIFSSNIDNQKQVNYEPLDSFLACNNALVIGVLSEKNDVIDNIILEREKEYSNILGIPVSIHIYQNDSLKETFNIKQLEIFEKPKSNIKKYPKFLPLGSIVILKKGTLKIMIDGYLQVDVNDKNKVYDYIGCIYPCGSIRSDFNILFNHEDIDEIIAIGLRDKELLEYTNSLLNK